MSKVVANIILDDETEFGVPSPAVLSRVAQLESRIRPKMTIRETIKGSVAAFAALALQAGSAAEKPSDGRVILARVIDGQSLVVLDRNAERQFTPIGEFEAVRTAPDSGTMSDHHYGTGFMVSPCYAMTAKHVVFGKNAQPVAGVDYTMTFRAGVSPQYRFLGNTIARPVLWGNGAFGSGDWILMKLQSCIGNRDDINWLQFWPYIAPEMPIVVIGFSADAERGVMSAGRGQASKCAFTCAHNASTTGGMSGAPVFAIHDGNLLLVGLHSGWQGDDTSGNNVFVPLSDLFLSASPLKKLLLADIQANGYRPYNSDKLKADFLRRYKGLEK